jgi:hypothetical protein
VVADLGGDLDGVLSVVEVVRHEAGPPVVDAEVLRKTEAAARGASADGTGE